VLKVHKVIKELLVFKALKVQLVHKDRKVFLEYKVVLAFKVQLVHKVL
jgi:hypothetical protein